MAYITYKGYFMQEIVTTQQSLTDFKIDNLSLEDRQRFVGAFVWLVEEDKKQNPALYQRNIINQND